MSSHTTASQRDNSIDIMKGLIAIGMMASHSLAFVGISIPLFSHYINLTTFSSFMFCFGYVCNIAYFQKKPTPWRKMLLGAFKTLGAYYFSALLYSAFVLKDLSVAHLQDLFTLNWVAGCSEFLLSWAYLYIFMIIGAPLLKRAAQNKYLCIFGITVSLVFTFIDYNRFTTPLLGPIVGCMSEYYFPLIPYFSYFLIGSYLNQNKIIYKRSFLIASFVLSSLFFLYVYVYSAMPQRWGPSFLWIVGSYFFTYLYYIGAKKITLPAAVSKTIITIGKQTLLFLLINNLFCFLNSFLNIASHSFKIRIVSLAVTFGGSILLPLAISKIKNIRNQAKFQETTAK